MMRKMYLPIPKKRTITSHPKNTRHILESIFKLALHKSERIQQSFYSRKSIYKRNPESFDDIIQLAQICVNEKETETAQAIFEFVLQNTSDESTILNAQYFLLKNEIETAKPETYSVIQTKFETLLSQFGNSPYAIDLRILASHFKAFYLNDFEKAKALLEATMEMPINIRQKAKVKMELADVFVFNEKFNQAIIYYAQIQNDLPNDEFSHEASMRMAKPASLKKISIGQKNKLAN